MSWNKDTFTAILALIITAMLAALLVALVLVPMIESNKDILQIAAGVLLNGAGLAWGFYFGSSTGSKAKDAAMIDAAKKE